MRRLPPLDGSTGLCWFPMADRSAAVLVDLLLAENPSSWADSLKTLLAFDPPLLLWGVCRAAQHRPTWRPRGVGELAQWLAQEPERIFSYLGQSIAHPAEQLFVEEVLGDGENPSEKALLTSLPVNSGQPETLDQSQGLETAFKIQIEEDVFRAELAAQWAAATDPSLAEEAYFLGLLAGAERWISLTAEDPSIAPEELLPPWIFQIESTPCQVSVQKACDLVAEHALRATPMPSPSLESRAAQESLTSEEKTQQDSRSAAFADPLKTTPLTGEIDWHVAWSRAAQAAWQWSQPLPGLPRRFPHLLCALARVRSLEDEFSECLERAKLEAMAELAAGAGHEINNPLAVIAGRAQLLLHQETDPERRRSLALIVAQVRRAYEMIADLRLFARPPRAQIQSVELAGLVESVTAEWAPLAAEQGVTLVRTGHPGPLELQADPAQIQVALRAVVQNALEAVGREGHIQIVLEEDIATVSVRVTDNGPGILPSVREHLFDPFYSARASGRGLGLGLSKAWRIVVTNHHGRIDVQSVPGQGTTLCLIFPKRVDMLFPQTPQ